MPDEFAPRHKKQLVTVVLSHIDKCVRQTIHDRLIFKPTDVLKVFLDQVDSNLESYTPKCHEKLCAEAR